MKKLLLVILATQLGSCTSKTFESDDRLWEYLKNPDNGYFLQKEVNGYAFSLLYKPTDLLVKQELSQELKGSERKAHIKTLREKYGQHMYFSLSMSRNNRELLSITPANRQEFGAMVNQLAFGMREKVHVFTTQKDTLPMLDYVYPRMYGMSNSTNMLFVYPRDPKYLQACTEPCRGEAHLNITLEDLGTYTGEVRFKMNIKHIKEEPKLKL